MIMYSSTRRLLTCLVLSLVLAACDSADSTPKLDPTSTVPATRSPVLIDLQHDYERLSAAQANILAVWEQLAADEQVQCGEELTTIDPASISAEDDATYQALADLLQQAAFDIEYATTLWQTECSNPRPVPPPDVIDQGRFAARTAGDALREAALLLNDIQG
jgi:hypothetical protein